MWRLHCSRSTLRLQTGGSSALIPNQPGAARQFSSFIPVTRVLGFFGVFLVEVFALDAKRKQRLCSKTDDRRPPGQRKVSRAALIQPPSKQQMKDLVAPPRSRAVGQS